jgi:hypothetical protein
MQVAAERAATQAYEAIEGLSLPNARRLVDAYGHEVVLAGLRKLSWLREGGGVQNPAGMLVTLARTGWRARSEKPAPRFHAEPVRKSRHAAYVAPQDDALWQSDV